MILPVDKVQDRLIHGENILVPKGYYKYRGEVTFEGEKLTVELYYDIIDDKKLEPISRNGTYRLFDPEKHD